MKFATLKVKDKLKLCERSSELDQKFCVKHINTLFCGSYLFTMFTTLLLAIYVYHVDCYYKNSFDFERRFPPKKIYEHEPESKDKIFKTDHLTFKLENNLPYNLQTVEKSNHIQKENNVKSERKYSGRFDVKNFESEKIRREKRSSYSIGLDLDSQNDDPEVEFFDPNTQSEWERKDDETLIRAGKKSKEWVQLAPNCRISYTALTAYCEAAKSHCIQGPPISQGYKGLKGMKGDPGRDGRDGIPGEPGLDGVPGRAGIDGIPGLDGSPGFPGLDGKDGKDGSIGIQGPPGLPGPPGERGLTGSRGKTGRPGKDGSHGVPGVCVYKVKVNDTELNEMLIAPSIATLSSDKPRSVVVREGENVRLRCPATGTPTPSIEWIREDEKTISNGAWEATSLSGATLNITKINRVHMGIYKCIADNGIPPSVNQTYQIDVYFAPLIQVRNQIVYAENDSTASLECEIEAYPESIKYWEKFPQKLIEQSGYDSKYIIETVHHNIYKSSMRLNISKIRTQDFGEYHCVSKNEMGTARAVFHLEAKNPFVITKGNSEPTNVLLFGNKAPEKESYEDICGPLQTCPECQEKDTKCSESMTSLYDLVGGSFDAKKTGNIDYKSLPRKNLDCIIYAVGKPVFFKSSDQLYGSWLRDPSTSSDSSSEKIWMTKEDEPYHLYEFANKTTYRTNKITKIFRLKLPFQGNAHVVYNGFFYYFQRDEANIVKYDLNFDRHLMMRELDFAKSSNTNYLYSTGYNLVDFNVDDNGLWVIYTLENSNRTIVSKINPVSLEAVYSLNTSINHNKVGEMFIACGVLYAIDSTSEKNTKIRLALDLYSGKLIDVSLSFTNPFRKTTTVGYNHKNKELYSWDRGNQLIYPVRYHEGNQTEGDHSHFGTENFHNNNDDLVNNFG